MAKTYNTYKDSGIAWIEKIPSEWEVCQFKRVHSGTNVGESIDKEFWSDNENDTIFYTAGLKPIHTSYPDFPLSKYTKCNDILLSRNGTPYVYLPESNATYTDHIIRVSIRKQYDRNFIRYAISQSISFEIVDTVSIATWSASLWNEQLLPMPSLEEQRSIAAFLDKKCEEIDSLISLQNDMINDLLAYKQSVITESVTKGLDPNAKMKHSGVEWIGNMPETWKTAKFKNLFQIKKEIAGRLGYDILSVTQKGLKIKDITKNEGQLAQDYSKYQLVAVDDFVMNHMDLLTGFVDLSAFEGVTSPDYRTFRTRNSNFVDNHYYLKIFQICYWTRLFYNLGQGVSTLGRWRLPAEQQNNFMLPVPPIEEQKEIAKYLDNKMGQIDSLIAIKHDKIIELKNYKNSIIYEYVTGKKRV